MRIVINPDFEREIQSEAEYHAGLLLRAKALTTLAKAKAPKKTGYYQDSLGTVDLGPLGIFVRTNDFAGHMVEFGSVNNVAYAPIRRAVLESGMKLIERPKPPAGRAQRRVRGRGLSHSQLRNLSRALGID